MDDKILVVEDDAAIAAGLEATFASEGFEVVCVRDGRSGLERARRGGLALVILDIMLPGMSGLEITKKLRESGPELPIILLTARQEEDDRVLGLELGADDYITKPFSLRELVARARAVLRRSRHGGRQQLDQFRFGDVVVDFRRQQVTKAGRKLEFSAREFRLLAYFIAHADTMLSREQLLNDIWGFDVFPTTRTVDNHVARIRKKIEDEPDTPRFVRTVRGAGYLFEASAGSSGE